MSTPKNIFMCTGLVRCRSAWIANLLTYGDSFCYHDAMLGLDRIEQLKERLDNTPFPNVGISDPATLLYWRQIHEWYPKAKWVLIHRPLEDAGAAAAKAFGPNIALDEMFEQWCKLCARLSPLIIPFVHVSDYATTIADYCGVKVGAASGRVAQLCRMNIQVDPTWLRAELAKLRETPPQWMRKAA